jgi:Secretion system C-terminal sorting domain
MKIQLLLVCLVCLLVKKNALSQHEASEDWLDMRISFKSQQKDVYNLVSSDVLLVQNIADNGTGIAAAQTQGLLNHAYGYDYFLKPVPPSGQQLVSPPFANVAASSSVLAYPNPAKNTVTFNWQFPKGIEEGTVQLSDIQGRQVLQMPVNGQYGNLEWDTEGLGAGIYFLSIRFLHGASNQEKLVIIK